MSNRIMIVRAKGLTLLEMIIVLLVLGILGALAVPVYREVKTESVRQVAETTAYALVRRANSESWAAVNGGITTDTHLQSAATAAGLPTTLTPTPQVGASYNYASGVPHWGQIVVKNGSIVCTVNIDPGYDSVSDSHPNGVDYAVIYDGVCNTD